MGIISKIAWRYLFSKKSVNAINLISGIAAMGVLVSTAALIIILSVFNGFSDFALNKINIFSPSLKIEPKQGKFFDPAKINLLLKTRNEVLLHSEVLQDKVLLRYKNLQFVASLKGIDPIFFNKKIPQHIFQKGGAILEQHNKPYAVIGATVQAYLSTSLTDLYSALEIYSPRKEEQNSLNPLDEFTIRNVSISGILANTQDWDNFAFIPLHFARDIFEEPNKCTSIEIETRNETDALQLKDILQKNFGQEYTIKTPLEQNEIVYRLFNTEKWSVYLILCFILVISICNIIGSLSMMVIDKQKDIAILFSLGASKSMVQRIFFIEGLLIVVLGTFFGIVIGYGFCFLQQRLGLVKLGSQISVMEAYPIKMLWSDFFSILATILTIAIPANWIASKLSIKNFNRIQENIKQI